MLISIVAFAVNVLLLRALSDAIPAANAWVATLFRGVIGWLVIVATFRGRGFAPGRLVASPMLLMRGIVGAAGILLFYVTIERMGAGRAVIINLTYPVFGALMAALWLRERLNWGQVGWMGVGLVGLVVFLRSKTSQGGISFDEVLALLGAIVAGAAVVLIRVLGRSEHASTIYASQCLWSFLGGLPFGAKYLGELPMEAWTILIVASVLVSVGQLALTHSFRTLSVAKGSSIQMLLPLATGLGGYLFLEERYSATEIVGGLITLGATWQVVLHRGQKR